MQKTILITGSTDGIGLATAKGLVLQGHHVLLHGRNQRKLNEVEENLSALAGEGMVECYMADLSRLSDVEVLAKAITQKHNKLDVLINNAGVYKTSDPITPEGLDVRFVVNAIAPYLLTKKLQPLFNASTRIINLSSAAQSTVDVNALAGQGRLDDMAAYSQSKLAITMWSRSMGLSAKNGPVVISVNPGSLLGTKMVKEGFGMAGKDIQIGADILIRLALDDEFESASGLYFDNDVGQFSPPHSDALDSDKVEETVNAIKSVLADPSHFVV